MKNIIDKVKRAGMDLLVKREGPLTRELLQEPAKFGLGRVPTKLKPESTTTMVCGFCSTGCGLEVMTPPSTSAGRAPRGGRR